MDPGAPGHKRRREASAVWPVLLSEKLSELCPGGTPGKRFDILDVAFKMVLGLVLPPATKVCPAGRLEWISNGCR